MTLDEALMEIERLEAALYEVGFTVGPPPIWYRECARFHLGRAQQLSCYDPADPGAMQDQDADDPSAVTTSPARGRLN